MPKPLPLGEVACRWQANLPGAAMQRWAGSLSERCYRPCFVSVLALSVTFGDSSPKGGASPYPPGTSSLRASSRRAVVSGRSLAASIWPGETW